MRKKGPYPFFRGARCRHLRPPVALVAQQPLRSRVVCQRHVAAPAPHHVAAIATLHHAGGAAAVDEQNGLVALAGALLQRLLQRTAEDASVPFLQFLAHVHNLHPRQGLVVSAAATFQAVR